MASVKVKIRPSSKVGKEGSVYYQITHRRSVRRLNSAYKLYPEEWNDKQQTISSKADPERAYHVATIGENISLDLSLISKIEQQLRARGSDYTTDDIIDRYIVYTRMYTLSRFMATIISQLKAKGKHRTSETYASALSSFRHFRNNRDVRLDCITAEMMEDYQSWLTKRGVVLNTVSFYARILRAVYNRAVDRGIIEDRRPFRHVYTGIAKTVKRALPLSALRKIKSLKLKPTSPCDYARDMFLMSFYLRGMSFIDMAYLKKSDLRFGRLSYRRRKTGQLLIIKWTEEMQAISQKYQQADSQYLLPVLRDKQVNERSAYRNASYRINSNLKKIAALADIDTPLTMYVARHSWASAARTKGVPLNVISEGMGHANEATTRIYLAELDTTLVDNANSRVIKSLR